MPLLLTFPAEPSPALLRAHLPQLVFPSQALLSLPCQAYPYLAFPCSFLPFLLFPTLHYPALNSNALHSYALHSLTSPRLVMHIFALPYPAYITSPRPRYFLVSACLPLTCLNLFCFALPSPGLP